MVEKREKMERERRRKSVRARISMFTVLNPNRGAQGHSDWKFNLKIGELFRCFFSLDEHIDTMHVPCYAFVFTFR